MIEATRIESEEHGFELVLTGDFAEEFARYLADSEACDVRLRLSTGAALELLTQARGAIGPWAAERANAYHEWRVSASTGEDECGYDPSDPKHPGYHDLMAGAGDAARKRGRGE